MKISIGVIPHADQRYPTCGDWQWIGDHHLEIRVSELAGPDGMKQSLCVAIHELTEAILCKFHGIDQKAVDEFDMGPGADLEEPGDDPRAPYRREHRAAYVPELFLLNELDLDVVAYNKALEDL